MVDLKTRERKRTRQEKVGCDVRSITACEWRNTETRHSRRRCPLFSLPPNSTPTPVSKERRIATASAPISFSLFSYPPPFTNRFLSSCFYPVLSSIPPLSIFLFLVNRFHFSAIRARRRLDSNGLKIYRPSSRSFYFEGFPASIYLHTDTHKRGTFPGPQSQIKRRTYWIVSIRLYSQ